MQTAAKLVAGPIVTSSIAFAARLPNQESLARTMVVVSCLAPPADDGAARRASDAAWAATDDAAPWEYAAPLYSNRTPAEPFDL